MGIWTIFFQNSNARGFASPVPGLSFLPAPYRGWTRAGERRVQDNLHAHAQNAAIFPPKSGEKPYLEVFSRFGLWRDFLNDNIQATISAFRLIKNMLINPKSVEFHQYHAKPFDLFLFFYPNVKDNERNLCQDLLTIGHVRYINILTWARGFRV